MKRYGSLKTKWCNYEALLVAFNQVKKGKSYHEEVIKYEMNLVTNLNNLLANLSNNTYRPKPLREFYVYIPKKRLIHAPAFEDRIVHHAIMNVIEPIIDKRFISDTYACRKNKGGHKASQKLQMFLSKSGCKKYLKLDIQKFFYSINHDSLIAELNKIIKDGDTIETLKLFFGNNNVGLPLGNVTSQLLANLILNPIDHFIKRTLNRKYYIRYMDDMIILGDTKKELKEVWSLIKQEVQKYGLQLNSKSHVGDVKSGVDFVGYKTKSACKIIRKSTLYNIYKRLKKCNWETINSYLAHAKYSNSLSYLCKMIVAICPLYIDKLNNWLNNNNKTGELCCILNQR